MGCPYFTDEEAEAHRGEAMCPGLWPEAGIDTVIFGTIVHSWSSLFAGLVSEL